MNNTTIAFVIGKSTPEQRQQFKDICHQQNISVQQAIPLLMQKIIDGEMVFGPVEREVLVTNQKL